MGFAYSFRPALFIARPMSTPDRPARPVFDPSDDAIIRYRGVSALAVVGLLSGILSVVAMVGIAYWLLPLVAIVLNVAALRQIQARAPELIGRKAALLGMFLALTFAVAAPAEQFCYRQLMRREAQQFAAEWFDVVRRGECDKAHHLTIAPKYRAALDDSLWDFYRKSDNWRKQLKAFVDGSVMRTLLALGPTANARFYETDSEGQQESGDYVQLTYAISYDDEQKSKTTFFVRLLTIRSLGVDGKADWQLAKIEGDVRPQSW